MKARRLAWAMTGSAGLSGTSALDRRRDRSAPRGSGRGPGCGWRCAARRGGRRGSPAVSRPPRAPKASSIRCSCGGGAAFGAADGAAELERDRRGAVAGKLAREDLAVEGDDDAGRPICSASGRATAKAERGRSAARSRRGAWEAPTSFESRGLEVAVVEAEGDDDVVGFAAFLEEAARDALEARDVFGAKGGRGPAEVVGLASEGGEPAVEGRAVRDGPGDVRRSS